MLRASWFLVALLSSAPAWSAEPEEAPPPALESVFAAQELADEAMDLIAEDRIQEAFDHLAPFWPISQPERDALTLQIVRQRSTVGGQLGKALGPEFVTEQQLGGSVLRLLYLEKFERSGIAWSFLFYNAGDHWILNTVSFTGTLAELF